MAMSLRDTIVPKSDQLNYDDVMSAPLVVTVTGLGQGSDDQPVIVKVADAKTGDKLRDYKPCKTMRRVLIAVWGDKGKDWVGQSMALAGDPSVTWAGEKIGGIRIAALTGIDKPKTMILTVSRGKRTSYEVKPLKVDAPTKQEPAPDDDAAAGDDVEKLM